MLINSLHSWDLSPKEAVILQKQLQDRIRSCPLKKNPRLIAGTDVSYDKGSKKQYATVVVLSYPNLDIIEREYAVDSASFPYVPGLLSFREAPLLIKTFEKLSCPPDLILCDGQGLAHPRKMGLACHLGLILNIPTVGVAKSPLYGKWKMPGLKRGSMGSIITREREVIGNVVRSKDSVRPLYVSVGHLITLKEAVFWTLKCTDRYRLPEPTRQAHLFANQMRKKQCVST